MWASQVSDELRALIPRPQVDLAGPLFNALSIDARTVSQALERVGAKRSFDDFPLSDLYALLMEIPSRDPSAKSTKSLYRAMIEKPEGEVDPNLPAAKKFHRSGRLWGSHAGKADYYPVGQLFYLSIPGESAVNSAV